MKGLDDIMKQAQQMQEKMQQAQEQIAQLEVHGEAAAGMVSVVLQVMRVLAEGCWFLGSRPT